MGTTPKAAEMPRDRVMFTVGEGRPGDAGYVFPNVLCVVQDGTAWMRKDVYVNPERPYTIMGAAAMLYVFFTEQGLEVDLSYSGAIIWHKTDILEELLIKDYVPVVAIKGNKNP